MPKITELTPEQKEKKKIYKAYAIEYECKCGVKLIYEADEKPVRLTKCFKCQNKYQKIT